MESPRGGFPPGPAVGDADLAPTFVANLGEVVVQVLDLFPRRNHVEPRADPLEKSRIPFRPQEHTEQLASDARVIDEPASDLHQADPFAGASGQRPIREQAQRHIPVPDPPNEAREALQSTVVPLQFVPGSLRKEARPDGDPHAEPTKVAVEPMERGGGRARGGDQAVELMEGGIQSPLELLHELGDCAGGRAWASH